MNYNRHVVIMLSMHMALMMFLLLSSTWDLLLIGHNHSSYHGI